MITAKYQNSRAFLCVVLFLLKSQRGFGEAVYRLETPGQTIEGLTPHYSQKRMLGTMFEIGCEVEGSCATSNTFDGSSISYSISLPRKAEVEIQLEIGKAQRDLKFDLQTSSNAIETDIWLDESGKIVSADGSWSRTIQIGSSSTDRSLKIQIVNDGIFSQQVSLQITQGGSLAEDIVSTGARIWVIVVAVIGSLLFLALICICRRRVIRRRMMMNRLRNRYRAEQNENQPPQVVIQYQPVQYPAPIQYDNNQAPQNNNLPLAPPAELVLPKFAPESVLLSEDNFEQRFPEAQMEDFQTHFPQKTCSICLEDLNRNQKCRQLSCEHIFHSECVKLWLLNQMKKQNHANCPNCNKDMTVAMERAKQSN